MTHDDAAATTLRTGLAPSLRAAGAGVLGSAWNAVSGAIGIVMGLIPHGLHHVGLLGSSTPSGAVLGTCRGYVSNVRM